MTIAYIFGGKMTYTTTLQTLALAACCALSLACTCFPHHGPEKYCGFPVIVRGTAVAEWMELDEPLDHSDPFKEFNPFADWVYSVEVQEAILVPANMTSQRTVKLRTPTQGSMCGTRFALDVQAVFFARLNHQGQLVTGLCEPNAHWDALSDWDKELVTDHIVDVCTHAPLRR